MTPEEQAASEDVYTSLYMKWLVDGHDTLDGILKTLGREMEMLVKMKSIGFELMAPVDGGIAHFKRTICVVDRFTGSNLAELCESFERCIMYLRALEARDYDLLYPVNDGEAVISHDDSLAIYGEDDEEDDEEDNEEDDEEDNEEDEGDAESEKMLYADPGTHPNTLLLRNIGHGARTLQKLCDEIQLSLNVLHTLDRLGFELQEIYDGKCMFKHPDGLFFAPSGVSAD